MASKAAKTAMKPALGRSTRMAASQPASIRPAVFSKHSYTTAQALRRAHDEEISRYAYVGVAALIAANGFVIWTEIKDPSNSHWRDMATMRPKAQAAEEEAQQAHGLLHREDEYSIMMRRSRHPIISLHMKW